MNYTVYMAVEVEALNEGDATSKVTKILEDLNKSKSINNQIVYLSDNQSISVTKKSVTDVLYLIVKTKEMAEDIMKDVDNLIEKGKTFSSKIVDFIDNAIKK